MLPSVLKLLQVLFRIPEIGRYFDGIRYDPYGFYSPPVFDMNVKVPLLFGYQFGASHDGIVTEFAVQYIPETNRYVFFYVITDGFDEIARAIIINVADHVVF